MWLVCDRYWVEGNFELQHVLDCGCGMVVWSDLGLQLDCDMGWVLAACYTMVIQGSVIIFF